MTHPLKGRKQKPEHIRKRTLAVRRTFADFPRDLVDPKVKILAKVSRNKNGCWVWIGAIFKKEHGNYGQMRVGRGGGKLRRAHIVSYETFVGKISEGLELDHLCHNTLCVNPEHLEPVTHAENMKRRKDSNLPNCKHGHLYTPETTYINVRGRRECKTCIKLRYKKYHDKG